MKSIFPIILLAGVVIPIAGCASSTKSQSLAEQAAIEATAIVQRAEATAIVLRAQATATAMIQSVNAPKPTATLVPQVASPITTATPVIPTRAIASAPTPSPTVASTTPVEVLGVGFAYEGGMIMVQFRAPPLLARSWIQGMVYVVDEATGIKYDDIPVAPLIGPLFGRPKEEGQLGYVMLINANLGIKPGSIVTVVLGEFKQEHVTVLQ